MSYYATRARNINGFEVKITFEEFFDELGSICIDFESTNNTTGLRASNIEQDVGFSVADIRAIFRGIKIMIIKANNEGQTTFCFSATNKKRYNVYKRFIKMIEGEITKDDGKEHVTFEAIV